MSYLVYKPNEKFMAGIQYVCSNCNQKSGVVTVTWPDEHDTEHDIDSAIVKLIDIECPRLLPDWYKDDEGKIMLCPTCRNQ